MYLFATAKISIIKVIVSSSIKVIEDFVSALEDSSSKEFRMLANEFEKLVRIISIVYMHSILLLMFFFLINTLNQQYVLLNESILIYNFDVTLQA